MVAAGAIFAILKQELSIQQQPPVSNLTGAQEPVILNVTGGNTSLLSEENLVEKTLLSIQEKVLHYVSRSRNRFVRCRISSIFDRENW